MIVTVFRSRLRPGVREEYVALVEKIAAIARTMPGYISHKGFFAEDGERVTIVEFEHDEGMRAWRTNILRRKSWRAQSTTVSITCRSARSSASRNSRPKTRPKRTPERSQAPPQRASPIIEVAVGFPPVAALGGPVGAIVEPGGQRPLLERTRCRKAAWTQSADDEKAQ